MFQKFLTNFSIDIIFVFLLVLFILILITFIISIKLKNLQRNQAAIEEQVLKLQAVSCKPVKPLYDYTKGFKR